MRRIMLCAAIPAALAARASAAPDDDDKRAIEELRREMAEMKAGYERRISELEKRGPAPAGKSELQSQIDDLIDRLDATDAKVGAAKSAAGGGRAAYLDVSFNSLFTAGTSTAREETLEALQGGGHDPHKRGFTVQNTELVLTGAVDPYFKGQLNLVAAIDPEGETVVELEEAFAQTTSLPGGLQVKAGQFFTEFGRLNPQHPHQWEFVDQPVVNTRFFGGDGMRGQGARVSWLAPTDFPLELQVGAQNANGETMVSFLGTEEEAPPRGAFVPREVRSWDHLAWTGRAAASFDLSDEIPTLFGVSGAFGPSGASEGGRTSIVGADVTVKWKPLANDHGFPFVALQAEAMRRRLGFDGFADGATFVPGGKLEDTGGYAQLVWGFARDWTLGVRHDRVRGEENDFLGMDDRNRWSAALTFYTSEFAKIRLQANRDHAAALRDPATSVWLQFEFNLGTHAAHRF
jgi:hypothetical protein